MSEQPIISDRAFLRQKIDDLRFARFRRLIGECVMRYSCNIFDRVFLAILQDFKARRLLGRAQNRVLGQNRLQSFSADVSQGFFLSFIIESILNKKGEKQMHVM